jgi:[ribosomal protein S18]-alanine N-acetyltransferase
VSAVLSPQTPTRRPMALHDIDAVHAIETRAYGFPWSRGNFVDSLAAGHVAQVLELDTVVGYFVALPGVDELHLLNITIAPPWQNRGHGGALLDAVCSEGHARGLATLWLEVRASNHGAQALYLRRGFAVVGRRRGYYPAAQGREDAVLMSLALRSGPEAAP